MFLLLNEAHSAMDVQNALKILLLSNNFYIEEGAGSKQREYLQNGISKHKIWGDFKFWERAIYESIQEDLPQDQRQFDGDKQAVTK
jgi:hypothetical protein